MPVVLVYNCPLSSCDHFSYNGVASAENPSDDMIKLTQNTYPVHILVEIVHTFVDRSSDL